MIAHVFDAANPLFTDVARGVEDAARRRGSRCSLPQRVEGILITPVDGESARFAERGTPVVPVDRESADGTHCSVAVDDVLGGLSARRLRLRADHLALARVPSSIVSDEVIRNA